MIYSNIYINWAALIKWNHSDRVGHAEILVDGDDLGIICPEVGEGPVHGNLVHNLPTFQISAKIRLNWFNVWIIWFKSDLSSILLFPCAMIATAPTSLPHTGTLKPVLNQNMMKQKTLGLDWSHINNTFKGLRMVRVLYKQPIIYWVYLSALASDMELTRQSLAETPGQL